MSERTVSQSGPAGEGRAGGPVTVFLPTRADRLPGQLADWIDDRTPGRQRIGVDADPSWGGESLADEVADELRRRGRPTIRASTRWWWRAAALRLEYGHTDPISLRRGWVDTAALRRELLDPLRPDGSGRHLRRLRDPATDRSVREPSEQAGENTVVVLDGPFLADLDLGLDAVIGLRVSAATVRRSLPPERAWWAPVLIGYLTDPRRAVAAAVEVAADHWDAPAVRWSSSRG